MKIKDIEKKIGTLSNPSKMPSYAWGIPIQYCKTGSILAEQDARVGRLYGRTTDTKVQKPR